MCGIIGIFSTTHKEEAAKALMSISTRGQDAQHTRTLNKGTLGHTLHAIIGHTPQPLTNTTGTLVANCEIYNWQELGTGKNDADVLLKLLDKTELNEHAIKELLEKLDGDYAFIYTRGDDVIFARDPIGVKPLWYSPQEGLSIASEHIALKDIGRSIVNDLNPRFIGHYQISTQQLEFWQRPFYHVADHYEEKNEEQWSAEVAAHLQAAIKKRTPSPDIKVGVLLSGGLDSTLIAKTLKDMGITTTCYTAYVDNPLGKTAHDYEAAITVAQRYGLELNTIAVSEKRIPALAEAVTKRIGEAQAVKVAVGMPFLVCAAAAAQDGCKVIFSGLGAEECYAGYKRHKDASDVNNECLNGLMWMYERDLYRDDTITMNEGVELRVPFLDKKLIEHALTIPGGHKIKDGVEKYILRLAAEKMGLEHEDAFRPKKAAQYGSKFDNALEKVARREGKNRVDYLKQFTTGANRKLGVLCSGGKDSWYAAYVMARQNYALSCLLAMNSENQDSYMFHTPAIELVSAQSEAAGIPLLEQTTQGEKEEELKDLRILLQRAREEYGIDGVVVGALYSQYQRERIETICNDLGLKCYAPLWHIGQANELHELLREGFVVTMSAIAGEGMSAGWLGNIIDDEAYTKLLGLERQIGFNVAGEGGEYESLVLDCPLFSKRLDVKGEAVMENEITGRLRITDVKLVEKTSNNNMN